MKRIKFSRKLDKFFTIMLIPDSPSKIRRLSIPYWMIGALGVPVFFILIIVILFQVRVFGLEGQLDYSTSRLSQTIYEKERLRETLVSAEDLMASSDDVSHADVAPMTMQFDEYEERLAEIMDRIDAIDGVKYGIISVFEDLAAQEVPFRFDESTLSGGVVRAQGGSFYTSEPADIVAELDAMLARYVDDMQTLSEITEELEYYFRARPAGWPVNSRQVGSEFGYRLDPFTGTDLERHEGIDIAVPVGSEVYATAYGVVTFAGWNTGGFGYLVIITHDFDYSTYFGHNSRVLVAVGDEVARGDLIALSGNTGRSTSPHCHYEVRLDGLPQNPREYMN